jgi:RNA polymerase sigma-70 factor (ECF subfamily)
MPPEEPLDLSLELVRRIQHGDRDAFGALYLRYRDGLLLAIRGRLGRNLRAWVQSEDVLHSVVKDALVDLERFEPRGPGSLLHWLHVCALNKSRAKAEHYGADKRAGEERLPDSVLAALPGGSAELGYLDGARYERLERGLAQLPDAMREIVLLRSVEGLGNEEAAAVLGTTPGAASKLYNRALVRLGAACEGGA